MPARESTVHRDCSGACLNCGAISVVLAFVEEHLDEIDDQRTLAAYEELHAMLQQKRRSTVSRRTTTAPRLKRYEPASIYDEEVHLD